MKRMDPPITLSDTYEKVRPRLLKAEEFQAVSSEDSRRAAFDKHMRRLREKEDEAERREKRRDRGSVERPRGDRDRSRGERSHRSTGRSGRRSRSPEADAYEADRRRAIAERERNHRKSAMAENFLSSDRGRLSPPPRRERERERERDRDRERERDRDLDRPPRSRRDDDSYYERERRDREEERERLYRRRIDRGSYDELPYGDEKPLGSRRRRPDDEDDYARRDSRDSKVRFSYSCLGQYTPSKAPTDILYRGPGETSPPNERLPGRCGMPRLGKRLLLPSPRRETLDLAVKRERLRRKSRNGGFPVQGGVVSVGQSRYP